MLSDIYELKQKLISENRKGIALDIDETLSWTIGYWVEKMQELFGNPENLTVRQLIEKYRYTQTFLTGRLMKHYNGWNSIENQMNFKNYYH